jgi:hypothetical protein
VARPRDYKAEAARRNEAARTRGYSSYYAERVARAEKQHKGISRAAARGHATPDEREVARFLRLLKTQPADAQVAFTSLDRRKDGTYGRGRFDVLYIGKDGEPKEATFVIDAKTLDRRMDEIADTISAYIGQGFLGWGSP